MCACGWADRVIFGLFGTQAAERRQQGQEGEEHAQVGDDAKTLGRIETDGRSELGMHANVLEFQVHMLMPSSPP